MIQVVLKLLLLFKWFSFTELNKSLIKKSQDGKVQRHISKSLALSVVKARKKKSTLKDKVELYYMAIVLLEKMSEVGETRRKKGRMREAWKRCRRVFPNPEEKGLKGMLEGEPFQMKTDNTDWKEEV